MWHSADKFAKPTIDVNAELMKLVGELEDKEAKITLAKFLRLILGLPWNLFLELNLLLIKK